MTDTAFMTKLKALAVAQMELMAAEADTPTWRAALAKRNAAVGVLSQDERNQAARFATFLGKAALHASPR